MKYPVIAAIVACSLAAACSFKSERTVVERPAPASTAVVTTDPPPPPSSTTVVVPAR